MSYDGNCSGQIHVLCVVRLKHHMYTVGVRDGDMLQMWTADGSRKGVRLKAYMQSNMAVQSVWIL